MAGRSSIEELPPELLAAVHSAIERGWTIDQITTYLAQSGEPRSRSAVGRYSAKFSALASRQREMAAVAEAFGKEFGADDGTQGRLLIQLVQSMATRAVMGLTEEEVDPDGKELHYFARSVKDIMSAQKIDADREAKIREEARKQAKQDAANAADAAGRAAGASEDTLNLIRARILGIDA